MPKIKTTKKEFCVKHPECKRLRKTDPIQFDVLYNDWVRTQHKIKRNLEFLYTLQLNRIGIKL
jgi:hypothetical protein